MCPREVDWLTGIAQQALKPEMAFRFLCLHLVSKIIDFLKSHHPYIDLNRADLESSMNTAIALHHSLAKFLESSLHLDEVLSMRQLRPDNHLIVF